MQRKAMRTEKFRSDILAYDDTHGFIEREQAIDVFLKAAQPPTQAERYASALALVLDHLSAPVREYDLILGTMVQGKIPYKMEIVSGDGYSHADNPFAVYDRCAGHCCPDYEKLLHGGLQQIQKEIEEAAYEQKRESASLFAACAEKSIAAICRYANRYALQAERQAEAELGERRTELLRAAQALKRIPYKPAETFFEALQAVWLIHMILSACAGGRDFAFGRLDRILLPFYERDLQAGRITEEQAAELLENFLLRCNEFGGKIPVQANYKEQPDYKPVPCSSTKQYLVLGGVDENGKPTQNRLSELILEAALSVKCIEPVFVILLSAEDKTDWKYRVHDAAQRLQGQVTVFNDDIIVPRLRELGVPPSRAANYVMTGCNGVTFPGMQHTEIYHNAGQWLTDLLMRQDVNDELYPTFESLLYAFRGIVYESMEQAAPARRVPIHKKEDNRFHLESLFFTECRKNAQDIENGGQDHEATVHFIAGAATVINSLCTLDALVYTRKTISLGKLRAILQNNFEGDKELLRMIRKELPKFGNDDDTADWYAKLFCDMCHDSIERLNREETHLHSGGFYGLYWQYKYGAALPATPDGRMAGEPISENMSPSYGTDRNGITAMLKSVAAMGLRRSTTGGLNIKFTKYMPLPECTALFDTFFRIGGLNYAVTVADKETLLDAKAHPEKYQNLCVRITGYSEYFTKLPPFIQDEIIMRTAAN